MTSLSELNNNNQTNTLWKDNCILLLNKHIDKEIKNFVTYEALSSLLNNGDIGLIGLSKKMRKEADEELKHARDFIDYQNKRGGKVHKINYESVDISYLEQSQHIMIDVYTLILEMEKQTNLSLVCLHNNVEDSALQDLIETYLHEQHSTQKEINDLIMLLKLGGDVYEAIHEKELR